jgi:hypothetical protein
MPFDWREQWRRRPWQAQLLLAFCAYMTFVYVPYDFFFKPTAEDQEVWFGFVLRGAAAKWTEPLHWIIYAGLGWGFWRMTPWVWPAAAIYTAQIAIGMLVWNLTDPRGFLIGGVVSGAVFGALAWWMWNAREGIGTTAE